MQLRGIARGTRDLARKQNKLMLYVQNFRDMDTQQKQNDEILDFLSFIKKYFTTYELDGHNQPVIKKLGLWAIRSEKFNNRQDGSHIDRGILLSGPVGAGKDELIRILKQYLRYLRSPYVYSSKVVWEFARPFMKEGYECFREDDGNIYYEELALTDERTGEATREFVSHYGTKLLIGAEIINIRYTVFKNTGYQTHFSTNLTEDELEKVYGSRCMSRLYEMCNFIFLTGNDRRGKIDPLFLRNKNQPPIAPQPKELDPQIHIDNKNSLDEHYRDYLQGNPPSTSLALVYNFLASYGVCVATDDELRAFMEECEKIYLPEVGVSRMTLREKEATKSAKIWEHSRVKAVNAFFEKMKAGGANSIFGEVTITGFLRPPDERTTNGQKQVGNTIKEVTQ